MTQNNKQWQPHEELIKQSVRSIVISDNIYEKVKDFIRKLKMIKLVPSLGCYTTTVCDTRTSHGGMSAEERQREGISDGVLRVSAGLENTEDILEDFDSALSKL